MLVTFDAFLDEVYPDDNVNSVSGRKTEIEERKARLAAYPHSVILELSYPLMDFATRWCWLQFGPAHGECDQYASEFPACHEKGTHAHSGKWRTHWLEKTDYDFGFNEWLFVEKADQSKFLEFVPHIINAENLESGVQ